MIIKAYYAGGRIDVFDTDRMTDGIPQPGNLLTNYTLDLADVGEECLWLRSYYYETADAYKEDVGPTGLPVARRRAGWSFLIADEEDLKALNRLTLDGETVLVTFAGEFVDASALSWADFNESSLAPMAQSALAQMSRISSRDFPEDHELSKRLGMTMELLANLLKNSSLI